MNRLGVLLCFAVTSVLLAQNTRGVGVRPATPQDPLANLRAGKRYALLIATDEYNDPSWPRLQNPTLDARNVAAELKANYGYEEPDILINATKQQVSDRIATYLDRPFRKGDSLLIFIAGHGKFDERLKRGYLVFKDSKKNDPLSISYMAHSELSNYVDSIACDRILLVIDACFGGTFDNQVATRSANDLDYPEASKAEIIARKSALKTRLFLTSGGKEYVPDGKPGADSPFTAQFLRALRTYGGNTGIVSFQDIFQQVQKVIQNNPQFGWFGKSDSGADFWFATEKATLAKATPAPAPPAGNTRGGGDTSQQLIQVEFEAIRNSDDPAALQAFVSTYKGQAVGQALVAVIEGKLKNIQVQYRYDSARDRELLPAIQGGKAVVLNRQGKVVFTPPYEVVNPYSERLALVRQNQKFGAIDLQGNLVIPVEFTVLGNFREGVALASVEPGRFGFVGRDGKWVIPASFKTAGPFSDGLARVTDDTDHAWLIDHKGARVLDGTNLGGYFSEGLAGFKNSAGKWGFKDKAGNWVIQPQYDSVASFRYGKAMVSSAGKSVAINKAGKVLAETDADYSKATVAPDPSATPSDLTDARKGGKWGFVNSTGKWVIPPTFADFRFGFLDGVAMVTNEDGTGWIDETGKWIFKPEPKAPAVSSAPQPQYRYDSSVDRLMLPMLQSGRFVFMNRLGKVLMTPGYELVTAYSERLALVRQNGKWGAIDMQGRLVIPTQFLRIDVFREGVAPACLEANKCGYIDPDGKWVIQPIYRESTFFAEDLAKVTDSSGQQWFIDHTGAKILDATNCGPNFSEGRIAAKAEDGKWGYKDRTGKWVIPPTYEAAVSFIGGKAMARINGKWNVIDSAGKSLAISAAEAIYFSRPGDPAAAAQPLFLAGSGRLFGFVDATGKWAIPATFSNFSAEFVGGVARVGNEDGLGWIDQSGNWVLKPEPKAK